MMSIASAPSRARHVELFRALGDATRLAILDVLSDEPLCVCDIQSLLDDVAPNLLSHHLRVLREAGLIDGTRRGRWIDYRLIPDALLAVHDAIPAAESNELKERVGLRSTSKIADCYRVDDQWSPEP